MAAKKNGKKRQPTIEVYESRKLEFTEVSFWDDLQEVARRILDEDAVPADAIVSLVGNRIEVEGIAASLAARPG